MNDVSALIERVKALKGVSVLCVGDAMLDRFIYGSVDRISPEAPIPVLCIDRESAMLGGAGNVVRNLVALGAQPAFVAVVGDDDAGREVGRQLGDHDGIDPCLVVESGRQTTIKTRFFANSQQLLRADRETRTALSAISIQQVLERAAGVMGKSRALVLSDYGKGVLSPELAKQLISSARAQGIPVIVDPKGTDYGKYAGATLLTPNRKELHEATGMAVDSDEAVVLAARHLIGAHGVDAVLVTRSQDGMSLVTLDAAHHLAAEAREVFDVSGAGDTVIATVTAAIAAGTSPLDAARLANAAAGIVVGKVGTAVTYADELIAALHHGELFDAESKVQALGSAVETVERWRRKGYRVGFTNGCFDLLHPGHISLLDQARATCDKLVVGLNSDASVRRLKGETRPVQGETARATVLASLAAVDMVVVFGEDTPLETISALKPDVLVKGADYTVETVVGADLVMGWGGKVVLADLVAGQSTTNTIRKMTSG